MTDEIEEIIEHGMDGMFDAINNGGHPDIAFSPRV
jgi:hypothetical protein